MHSPYGALVFAGYRTRKSLERCPIPACLKLDGLFKGNVCFMTIQDNIDRIRWPQHVLGTPGLKRQLPPSVVTHLLSMLCARPQPSEVADSRLSYASALASRPLPCPPSCLCQCLCFFVGCVLGDLEANSGCLGRSPRRHDPDLDCACRHGVGWRSMAHAERPDQLGVAVTSERRTHPQTSQPARLTAKLSKSARAVGSFSDPAPSIARSSSDCPNPSSLGV
jgi:hypothetical protein